MRKPTRSPSLSVRAEATRETTGARSADGLPFAGLVFPYPGQAAPRLALSMADSKTLTRWVRLGRPGDHCFRSCWAPATAPRPLETATRGDSVLPRGGQHLASDINGSEPRERTGHSRRMGRVGVSWSVATLTVVMAASACGASSPPVANPATPVVTMAVADAPLPAAPTNLRLTADGTKVSVTWDPAPPGAPPVTNYRLWFDTDQDVTLPPGQVNYVVNGLEAGSWHQARVAAVNSTGQGEAAAAEATMPSEPVPDPTTTALMTPPPAPATTAADVPVDAPQSESTFDRVWAIAKAKDVIDDIATLDERMLTGPDEGIASGLRLLSDSYQRLSEAGVPPGVDASAYLASLSTLSQFASQASDEMVYAPSDGGARYEVIRQHTGPLLQELGQATGTRLRLR